MPVQIKREDLEWLQEVRRLGLDGLTQQEIADAMGVNKSTLRSRLAALGFQMVGLNDVRTMLGGISLESLLERGDLVAAPDTQPAPALPVAA